MNNENNQNVIQETLETMIQQTMEAYLPDEHLKYCLQMAQALTNAVKSLHGVSDPTKIGRAVLQTILDFYQAKCVGMLEFDLDMETWCPRWFVSNEEDKAYNFLSTQDYCVKIPRWEKAFRENKIMLVTDVESLKEESPFEYTLFKQLKGKTMMGCPFYKHSTGFVVVMDAQRYVDKSDLLLLLTYVTMMELNEYKMKKSLTSLAKTYNIRNEDEIYVQLFDGIKIFSSNGVLTEEDFTPDEIELLTWMFLNPQTKERAHIYDRRIWKEVDVEKGGKKSRRAFSKIRNTTSKLIGSELISKDGQCYLLNPDLNIKIDVQQYIRFEKHITSAPNLDAQQMLLESIVQLYKGPIRNTNKNLRWMDAISYHYENSYRRALNRLLGIYYQRGDYKILHDCARGALTMSLTNSVAYFWKVLAYRSARMEETAAKLLAEAKKNLEPEYYQLLEKRIKEKDFDYTENS